MIHLRIVVCMVTAFKAHSHHFHYHVHVQLQLPCHINHMMTFLPTLPPSTPSLAFYRRIMEVQLKVEGAKAKTGWSHIHLVNLLLLVVKSENFPTCFGNQFD